MPVAWLLLILAGTPQATERLEFTGHYKPVLVSGITIGYQVTQIHPGSAEHALGLENGDIILTIGNQPARSIAGTQAALAELLRRPKVRTRVVLRRQGIDQEIFLPLSKTRKAR